MDDLMTPKKRDLTGPESEARLEFQPNAEEAAARWTKNLETGVAGFHIWLEGAIIRAQGEERKTLERVEQVHTTIFPRGGRT